MSAYLTSEQAAAFLGFKTVVALRCFLYRRRKAGYPIPTYRIGRGLRFKQIDLEDALTADPMPRASLRRVR